MRRAAAVLAAMSLAATLAASTGSTAHAAETCDFSTPTVKPAQVTVDTSWDGVTSTVKLRADDCSSGELTGVNLFWVICGPFHCDALTKLKRTSEGGGSYSWTGSFEFGTSDPAGTYPTSVDIVSDTTWYTNPDNVLASLEAPSIVEKYKTKVTLNATPEPIRKNKTLTIKGTIKRADWYDIAKDPYVASRWLGTGNRKVALQFRTTNGKYATVKTITSKSKGVLSTTVKATRDGCYRFVYKGSKTITPVTGKGDCIDVR